MKYLIFMLFIGSTVQAKQFIFTYNMPDHNRVQTLKYKTEAKTWQEAFERGATFCYDYFVDKERLTDDRIVLIVDVCANPSEK